MTSKYLSINNLKVSEILLNFINNELLKDTEISKEKFWNGFDKAVHELAPENRKLIQVKRIYKKNR